MSSGRQAAAPCPEPPAPSCCQQPGTHGPASASLLGKPSPAQQFQPVTSSPQRGQRPSSGGSAAPGGTGPAPGASAVVTRPWHCPPAREPPARPSAPCPRPREPGPSRGGAGAPRVAVAAPPRHSPSACSREFMAAAGQRAGPSRPLTAPPPPPAARPGPTPQQCRALLGSPHPARHAPFSKRGSHSPERALRGGAGGGAGSVGGGCGGARSSARRRRLRAPGPGMRPLSGACGPAPGPVALRGAAATAGGCPRAAPGGAPCTVPSPEPRVPAASRCPGGALGYPGRQLPPVTAPRVTERCARCPRLLGVRR